MTNDDIVETRTDRLGTSAILRTDRLYYIEDDPRWPYEEGEYFGYTLYGKKPLLGTIQIKIMGDPSEEIWFYCMNDVCTDIPDDSRRADIRPRSEPYNIIITAIPLSEKDVEAYWIHKTLSGKALEITRGRKTAEDKVRNILDYVGRIPHDGWNGLLMHEKQPIETIKEGANNCKDYAELMFQMCRSVGVPARKISGIFDVEGKDNVDPERHKFLVDDRYIGHRWIEYHNGKGWSELDPSNDSSQEKSGKENNYKALMGLRTFSTNVTCEFIL